MSRVPRWASPASLALALGGTAVSAYLTIAHYTSPNILACSSTGTVNCERVTTSAQSTFLGVPVALLGLLWFAGMTLLCLPFAWRSTVPRAVHVVRFAGAVAGVGFVVWLVYAELFLIQAICLWCTVAHVFGFGLFAVVVITAPDALGLATGQDEDYGSYS